jgi:hypothetical protein
MINIDVEKEILDNIKKIDNDIINEHEKPLLEQDKEKIFKLRYAQMIQGLYLNQYK